MVGAMADEIRVRTVIYIGNNITAKNGSQKKNARGLLAAGHAAIPGVRLKLSEWITRHLCVAGPPPPKYLSIGFLISNGMLPALPLHDLDVTIDCCR